MSMQLDTMSVQGAAAVLGVHDNTIRNWINSGRIGHVQLGEIKRPIASEVTAMVASMHTTDLSALADELEPIAASYEEKARMLRYAIDRIRSGGRL